MDDPQGPHGLADVLAALKRAVEGSPRLAAAYVYGSTARGHTTPLSDLDVALLFSADLTDPGERRQLASDIAVSLARDLGSRPIDIRDAEALPLAVQGEVVTGGVRAASTDDVRRVRFEADVRQRYFDFLPFREASVGPALRVLRERHSGG